MKIFDQLEIIIIFSSSTKQRLAVQHKPLQSNKKSNKG